MQEPIITLSTHLQRKQQPLYNRSLLNLQHFILTKCLRRKGKKKLNYFIPIIVNININAGTVECNDKKYIYNIYVFLAQEEGGRLMPQ